MVKKKKNVTVSASAQDSRATPKRYFSLKVATEDVFCNRETELALIRDCIRDNEHVVVVAPRRYGKTSLIMRAIQQSKSPHAMVDLFCVSYQEEVARKLAKAVTEITRQFVGVFRQNTAKVLKTLEGVFRSASISFKSEGLEVGVEFSHKENPVMQISDLLSGLESLAQSMNKKAVLFIDEFQDILKTDESVKIQSAIRAVAQHSKNITYVFSGSSRTMLEKIFENANQPLYLMCRNIVLKRISSERLGDHARLAWKNNLNIPLADVVVEEILRLTECHTYYFNHLCLRLISLRAELSPEIVEEVWNDTIEDELGKIVVDLQRLTANQMKILTHVSIQGVVNAPNSQQFVKSVALPLSSIQRSVKKLLDSDYLHKLEGGALKLVDPAIRYFLNKRYEG